MLLWLSELQVYCYSLVHSRNAAIEYSHADMYVWEGANRSAVLCLVCLMRAL